MTEDEAVNNLKACKMLADKLRVDPKYPYTEEVRDIFQGFKKVQRYYKNDAHMDKLAEQAGVSKEDLGLILKNFTMRLLTDK